jgi:hypothetical protein
LDVSDKDGGELGPATCSSVHGKLFEIDLLHVVKLGVVLLNGILNNGELLGVVLIVNQVNV